MYERYKIIGPGGQDLFLDNDGVIMVYRKCLITSDPSPIMKYKYMAH